MDILKAVTLIISMCTIVAGLYLIIISSRSKNKKTRFSGVGVILIIIWGKITNTYIWNLLSPKA